MKCHRCEDEVTCKNCGRCATHCLRKMWCASTSTKPSELSGGRVVLKSVVTLLIILLTVAVVHAVRADEKPVGKVSATKAVPPKDEISEVESLRYLVAFLKAQEVQRLACEAHPECVRAQADLRAAIGAIDVEHRIDRARGEGFNAETRAITRVPHSPNVLPSKK